MELTPMKGYVQLWLAVTTMLMLAVTGQAADVPTISGGVSSAERDELRAKERDYNLKVVTAMKSGDHLSGVQVIIESATKERILETTMAGPILLAKLPPGSHRIEATAHGKTSTQT